MARLQVALWALRQRRLDQLRAVHVPRHQQDPGGVVQRVRLFELVLQRPGLQGGALLHGQRQAGQQHAQQNPMQSFHACPSRVENTWMSLRRSQSDWARQNACASSAASRTKTWDLPIPPSPDAPALRRASAAPAPALDNRDRPPGAGGNHGDRHARPSGRRSPPLRFRPAGSARGCVEGRRGRRDRRPPHGGGYLAFATTARRVPGDRRR